MTITAGANQTVELEASLACAVLRPVIDPQLEAQYESYTLTVMESTAGKSAATGILQNGQDFFVRGGEGVPIPCSWTGQTSWAIRFLILGIMINW